ncbi:MAG: efflux RND transporter periplasmic adaptor subunit [Ectothiorhodospiraceae bacterium]|nr:efflux RND transporter periplasmic adaptor subunit [Ectothiorhodospiraceae bacterium]MCH8503687.1 efflux RND transporter periplasmic adaptor subunit [Ectothiorhodospiraceae bacterium]
MNKLGWIAAIAVIGAGTALWWWQQGETPSPGSARGPGGERSIAVEAAPVSQGSIQSWTTFTGSLTAAAQFDVAARIAGRLEVLEADLGDTVEQGQVIARLDDEEPIQELEQARAELAVARANVLETQASLEAAERALQRTRELREQRVASQSELDTATTEAQAQQARVELAKSQVMQREAAVRSAEIRLSYTTVRAIWQGPDVSRVVGERYADEGTLLQANSPILSLVSLNPVRAVVFTTESDYAQLRIGQEVAIRSDALPGRTFEGEIQRLAPVFREASRQARVEIRVPNPDGQLKPGMFVRARVLVDARDDATLIPTDALVERNGRPGVFLIDEDSRARFQEVETGIEEGEFVEIRRPAISGKVVTLGQHLLSDGLRVIVSEDEDALSNVGARR